MSQNLQEDSQIQNKKISKTTSIAILLVIGLVLTLSQLLLYYYTETFFPILIILGLISLFFGIFAIFYKSQPISKPKTYTKKEVNTQSIFTSLVIMVISVIFYGIAKFMPDTEFAKVNFITGESSGTVISLSTVALLTVMIFFGMLAFYAIKHFFVKIDKI